MRSAQALLIMAAIPLLVSACGAGPGSSAATPAVPPASETAPAVTASASGAVTPSTMPETPDPSLSPALQARAAQVLARWAAAVPTGGPPAVIPVGDLTGQDGNWEEAVGDNNKRALMAGQVFSDGDLTVPGTPASATVSWADGSTASVPILGAQEALAAISRSVGQGAAGAACDGCRPLTATSGKLTQSQFRTTRGAATGPVWAFTIRGTAVRVTRVAIADAASVPTLPDAPGGAVGIDSARGAVNGTRLMVTFVGAPGPGDRPCGEDYTAVAVESDLAVTVIVTGHPYVGFSGACAAIGASRTAVATLARPLGDRAVLDLATGQPVTVDRQP